MAGDTARWSTCEFGVRWGDRYLLKAFIFKILSQ